VLSVSPAEVPALAAAGDIGIMFKQDSLVSAVASPVKLGEYLAAGVPVVTNGTVRDATTFIREKNVGWADSTVGVPPVSAVTPFLASVESDRASWSQRCVAAARDFLSWQAIGPRIAEMYETVML
jgi:hypothetical protein